MATRHLLAAPDKFRGTISAPDAGTALCAGAARAGWTAYGVPVSDGGEGLLDCVGGANRFTEVSGPLDTRVRAGWRLDGDRAVIEMAAASGLALVTDGLDALAATTTGTGELIVAAFAAGAREVIVGAGGSATTDGGVGAVESILAAGGVPAGARLVVAADVRATFTDAARVFAPQKGADAGQVAELERRLEKLADTYLERCGVDVRSMPGSGAAGGLAGGLTTLGATIRSGFEVVADLVGLAAEIERADLVVTGEGRLDMTSLLGKAPVGVARLAARAGVRCVVVAGEISPELDLSSAQLTAVSLAAEYGAAGRGDPARCLAAAADQIVRNA